MGGGQAKSTLFFLFAHGPLVFFLNNVMKMDYLSYGKVWGKVYYWDFFNLVLKLDLKLKMVHFLPNLLNRYA
jgi:hypothetical protein